jgi:hypothetical protein
MLKYGSFLIDHVISHNDLRALGSRKDVLLPFAGG